MACRIQAAVKKLKERKASMRCGELGDLLEDLGFEIAKGRGGHKVVSHRGLPSFYTASYDCGHGKDPEIKPAYIRNIIRVLEQFESELIDYLES